MKTWMKSNILPAEEGESIGNWSADQDDGVKSLEEAKERAEKDLNCVAFAFVEGEALQCHPKSGWKLGSDWRTDEGATSHQWYYIVERCIPGLP